MAEFRKCFDTLDTEKRGVITIEDLRNYMSKMHYKETFLQKWIELFDPEHTGLITYEQYCKTLGLIPRKRTFGKDVSDSTFSSSSSSSLSVSLKQDNFNEVSIGSCDKNLDKANITTIIQEPKSNEPNQTIEQTIETTSNLKQTAVEITVVKQQEFPDQTINSIHQDINIDIINPTVEIDSKIHSIHTEKLTVNRKRKYTGESIVTVEENIILPTKNDPIFQNNLKSNEQNQSINHEVIISDSNENNSVQSFKQIIDLDEVTNELNLSSTNHAVQSFSEKKSNKKKSKQKQKHSSSSSSSSSSSEKSSKPTDEINTVDLDLNPMISHSIDNELSCSNIITPVSSDCEIKLTEVPYTTITTTTTTTTNTTTDFIVNESYSSAVQLNVNANDIDQSIIKHEHFEKQQTSSHYHMEIIEQHEENIQLSTSCPLVTIPTEKIEHNENDQPNNYTLSSVIDIPIEKTTEVFAYDSISIHQHQADDEAYKPNLLSTEIPIESNSFEECLLSKQTNQQDLEINDQIVQDNHEIISKQTTTEQKPHKKPSNKNKQKMCYIPVDETIDQQTLNTDHKSSPSVDFIQSNILSNESLFSTENQSLSESLIIPQNIQSTSYKPQVMNGTVEKNIDFNQPLSSTELVQDDNDGDDDKQWKKASKKSKKKREKKNREIDKTIVEHDTGSVVTDQMLLTESITTYLEHDIVQKASASDHTIISSEPVNEEYICPSIVKNQSNQINIQFSDPTFPEISSTDFQSQEVSAKQHTIEPEQVLNESQIIISSDDTLITTEINHKSNKVPVDNYCVTSESIVEVKSTITTTSTITTMITNINNDNDISNNVTVEQLSPKQGDTNEVTIELTPPNSDLNIEHEDVHKTSVKQSKKKHKKSKELIETNLKATESHTNATDDSGDSTSLQVTSIPQSTMPVTDVNQTGDFPLSIDVKIKEEISHLVVSSVPSDLTSPLSDGCNKKKSRNRKSKKVTVQSNVTDDSFMSTPIITPSTTTTTTTTSLIPIRQVHGTVHSCSSKFNDNNDIFTSLSIPFCKTICKVSHTELHNSNKSLSKIKSKKLQLKNKLKLKNSKTNILNQTDNLLNNGQSVINETTMEQSSQTIVTAKESQENTRKRRFPKSFITQVDPKYIRSARLAEKRRKTDSTKETKETSSTTDKEKTSPKRNTKQMLNKWRVRPSLRENGVIVILLAGRHRGKRVVSLGRQKSTGLLLVTGPYRYNGCPLRRVHPDYVIATKTKIDLSNLSLPKRIHTKEYFTRTTTTCKKFNKTHYQNRFEDILETGVHNKQSIYTPNDEKKSDQIYIDNEVRKAIKLHTDSKMLIAYLKSLFSIGKHDRPHEMLF
ncbi:unnamed protein product [Schistosoma turkestanicum]|nr:unnamed protein product [Schistosoma turkestanicum]